VEGWFLCEGLSGGVTGELVGHVDDAEAQEGSGGGFVSLDGWFGNEVVKLGGCKVGHEVDAAADSNTELSEREKEGGKVVGKDGGNCGTNNSAPCGAKSYRAEFDEVIRIFVECQEAARGKQRCNFRRDGIINDKADHGKEGVEIGGVLRGLVGFSKGVTAEGVDVVIVRSV
jgi:hypothetical protein